MNNRVQFNLYATPPHECSYLPDRQATTVFIDPHFPKDAALYDTLSQHGFRRSGEHLYRPHCHNCDACIPVRVPVEKFVMSRRQKRVWKKNQDLRVVQCHAEFKQEHFDLYNLYLDQRHPDGGMDNPTVDSYQQFLISDWAESIFYEFRLGKQLLAVAVADVFEHGLSAVYNFYDPEQASRGLGNFAVLWEIQQTRRIGLRWLYLGYLIRECQKMRYKADYQPLEQYRHGVWQKLEP